MAFENSTLYCVKSALPHLKKTNGCIVNICDILGGRPIATHLEYCISKGGLLTATKSLALLCGPEVK